MLVCCALPALLVTIGADTVLAGIAGTAPRLIALSEYKIWTFGISGAGNGMRQATKDKQLDIPVIRASIWCAGFFFALIAARVFY